VSTYYAYSETPAESKASQSEIDSVGVNGAIVAIPAGQTAAAAAAVPANDIPAAYIIFSVDDTVTTAGDYAAITNIASSGSVAYTPYTYSLSASYNTVSATSSQMYINVGIETVPFTSANEDTTGGAPVFVAYVAKNSVSATLISSLAQSFLSQTASGVPLPTLNTPTFKPMLSGSSYTYTIASGGGSNIAASSMPIGYSAPSPSVSNMSTFCAFYNTSDLASITGGEATFDPSTLPSTPVSVIIPASDTSSTSTTSTSSTPCAALLSGLASGGVTYAPASTTSTMPGSSGLSFVIYNALNGAYSVSIYGF
jgi:hypothetical protein